MYTAWRLNKGFKNIIGYIFRISSTVIRFYFVENNMLQLEEDTYHSIFFRSVEIFDNKIDKILFHNIKKY